MNNADVNRNKKEILESKTNNFKIYNNTHLESNFNLITTNNSDVNIPRNLNNTNKHTKRTARQILPIQLPHSPIQSKADESKKKLLVLKTTAIISSEKNYLSPEAKLPARYINNKPKLDSTSKMSNIIDASTLLRPSSLSSIAIKTNDLHNETIINSFVDMSSKLICSCEKVIKDRSVHSKSTTPKNVQSIDNCNVINKKPEMSFREHTLNSNTAEKRLILTRNAATSPNLDIRKLSSMTTICASGNSIKTYKNFVKPIVVHDNNDAHNYRNILEKSTSLNENKSTKLLRSTRSLSPRPQLQHQHAIIVSEVNDEYEETKGDKDIFQTLQYNAANDDHWSPPKANIANNYNQMILRHRKTHNTCRSEQSSPNVSNHLYLKYADKQQINRSTNFLSYTPSDPWLKMPACNAEKIVPILLEPPENQLDPWIKRNDIPTTFGVVEQERFHQAKAMAVAKDKSVEIFQNRYQSTQSNQERYTSRISISQPLQSAPASPHLPITLDKSFSSLYSLNNNDIQEKQEKVKCTRLDSERPMRYSSFSPIRAQDFGKSVLNINVFSPTPVISVVDNTQTSDNSSEDVLCSNNSKSNTIAFDHNLLNVYSPNLLQGRHNSSSSSLVTNSWRDEELHLNIRRLSDQMLLKSNYSKETNDNTTGCNVCSSNIKPFLSDYNINVNYSGNTTDMPNKRYIKRGNNSKGVTEKLNTADFSEYLKLFGCREAKKVVKKFQNICISNKKPSPAAFENILNKDHISKSENSLLETTC